MKDFDWLLDNENLFAWWYQIIIECQHKQKENLLCDIKSDDEFARLWEKAKEYTLRIVTSRYPNLKYVNVLRKERSEFHIPFFVASMLFTIKIDYLQEVKTLIKEALAKSDDKAAGGAYQLLKGMIYLLENKKFDRDYDYSKVDGGLTECEDCKSQQTITHQIEIPAEHESPQTITHEDNKDGSVKLPAVLDTNEFKKYLDLAKKEGLINDDNGKLTWIQIGNRGGNSQLAYFLGKVFGYIHSAKGNKGARFPDEELCRLFGVKRLYSLLTQVHDRSKEQKWRKKIDELFE